MITTTLKEIEAARAKLAQLEAAHAEGVKSELAALPAKYGFADVKAFAKAVKAAAGGKRAGKGKTGRTRATITDEMRAEVKKLAEAGKTGTEIAKKVGISLPSVQNIKKSFGLVKKRKK
jgi:hypothetical protein